MSTVAIVIPMLDEAEVLPRLLRSLAALAPPPDEVLAVDGGSTDDSRAIVRAGGVRVVECARGRALQINRGVAEVQAAIVCVLHADTLLPDDAVPVIRPVMADRGVALAGFPPLLFGDHAMFFRRRDFLRVGGCDPGLFVLEEADLCAKMCRLGRTRLVNRVVLTSDRRVAAGGGLRANGVCFSVGVTAPVSQA